MILESVTPRWQSCYVAAPGPSLVPVYDHPVIAVQDAWRLIPWADVLYGCDAGWWNHHQGTEFEGEKWSTHQGGLYSMNDKTEVSDKYGVRCVLGCDKPGFSLDPSLIHYGSNSGFQAVNLAILFGCTHITLVGFDMHKTGGRSHFFGEHPEQLRRGTNYTEFTRHFDYAQRLLPPGIRIVNATPGSALTCFPMMTLEEAARERDELFNTASA